MAIQVGDRKLTVTGLGRYCLKDNHEKHRVKIVDASNPPKDVTDGEVVVNMHGGEVDTFVYAPLDSPVTLNANGVYYVVSEERARTSPADPADRDEWYHDDTTVVTTDDASVTQAVFAFGLNPPSTYVLDPPVPPASPEEAPGHTFGPVDFQMGPD